MAIPLSRNSTGEYAKNAVPCANRSCSGSEIESLVMKRHPVLSLRSNRPAVTTHRRRGSIVMFVAMALLVVGACLALVFDRLWLDAAQIELQAAAEAAALAGAGQLASDARLQPPPVDLITPARDAAIATGQKNYSVGTSVDLRDGDNGDVQIGTIEMSAENGHPEFVADTERPTTCVVRAARLTSRGNPVALFFRELTSNTRGNVQAIAEASIDNRIIGVQPSEKSPVPALPIAILFSHTDPRRQDTWMNMVNLRQGTDLYGYDAESGEVTTGPDGIPEITLHTTYSSADAEEASKANSLILDIGTGMVERRVAEQVKIGWTVKDLKSFGGEFRTDQGPQILDVDAASNTPVMDELQQLIGQTRICGLYINHQPTSNVIGTATVVDLAAIRILAIQEQGPTQMKMTVQPAVIATRTALLSSHDAAWLSGDGTEQTNPYIFKLFLSH